MSDNFNNFINKNKYLIAIAAVAGVSVIGGTLLYLNQQPQPETKSSKKKKSKKKPTSSDEKEFASKSPKIYPVDNKGFPHITDEIISSLDKLQTEKWANALKEDGNAEFKLKHYQDAIKYYTAALQLRIDPVFYSNRSACYSALEEHENVIKDTTEAIKLKPDYTKCLLRRATSYEHLENYPDAMFDLTALTIHGGFSNKSTEQVLERVLKKHSLKIVENNLKDRVPDLPSASTIGSFFGAFVTDSAPEGISQESQGADKLLFEAIAKVNSNTPENYEKAVELFDKAIESYQVENLNSKSPSAGPATIALEYSAAFKFLKNDPIAATDDIVKAVELKPRPRTYVLRALIHADKSNYTEALKDFDTAIKLDPEAGDVYYHLGQLYYLTGDLVKAQENFDLAKKYNSQNVYAFVQSACITYKNGNVTEAEDKFAEAKLKFPTSPEIPNYYGEVLSDYGKHQLALKQFETAARLQKALPTFSVGALPLINQASLLLRDNLDKFDEAETLLKEACKLDPKSELACISLAQLKLQKEEVDEAIVLFERSSDLARTIEEKIQATSFAEATKMQKRIKADPVLSNKFAEVARQSLAAAS